MLLKHNYSSQYLFSIVEVSPFLRQKDVDSKYVTRFFQKPWDDETDSCHRCFLALFSNATLNALKLHNGESLTFGKFSKEVTPAIEGLLLAMLDVQGNKLVRLPADAKITNMDSDKAKVNKYRVEALYRRLEIKHYFSKKKGSNESLASSIPTVDQEDADRKRKESIAHQCYLKAVDKINALRNELNKKKRKRGSDDSVGSSLKEQNKKVVHIENLPSQFGDDKDWAGIENPDMSDIAEVVPV
jgi:hypothetical protein